MSVLCSSTKFVAAQSSADISDRSTQYFVSMPTAEHDSPTTTATTKSTKPKTAIKTWWIFLKPGDGFSRRRKELWQGKSDIFYIFIKITIRTFEIRIHFKIVISWDFLITFSIYYFQGFVYIFDSLMMQYIYINLHWVNYLASSNRLSKSIVTPIGYGHKGDRVLCPRALNSCENNLCNIHVNSFNYSTLRHLIIVVHLYTRIKPFIISTESDV